MINIKAIREAAEAATPGEWLVSDNGHIYSAALELLAVAQHCRHKGANAAHIATANPATVIALCDEIERLRLPDDWYPESKDWRESPGDRGLWLRTMYEQAKEEIDRLQKEVHNLNWALGTEGYTEMATPEEQAEHDAGMANVQAILDRMQAAKDAHEAMEKDAARYQWLKREHGLKLLHAAPAVRPWFDAEEVLDDSIDAAMEAKTCKN